MKELIITQTIVGVLFLFNLANGQTEGGYCGNEFYESINRSCNFNGPPDDPSIRDIYIPTANTPAKFINTVIHTFANDDGSDPLVDYGDYEEQLGFINEVFLPYKIQFDAEFVIHDSTEFKFINPYLDFGYEGPDEGKSWSDLGMNFSIFSLSTLNIFVVNLFEMNGIANFPWDNQNLFLNGSVLVHFQEFSQFNTTLVHEIGHVLGLWHIFRGVNEVAECGDCYEFVNRSEADERGDLCSDTRSTPIHNSCNNPEGQDCNDEEWGNTPFNNFMGYSFECQTEFSPQQSGRLHGWIEDELSGWLIPDSIRMVNQTEFGEILGGYLHLDDPTTPELENQFIPSGDKAAVFRDRSYNAKTHEQYLEGYYHYNWNDLREYFKLESPSINITDESIFTGISAIFKSRSEIQFIHDLDYTIFINDPWFLNENNEQPGDIFLEFESDEFYGVFIGHNLYFNPSYPIYRLRATEIVETGVFIYDFINWSGNADFNGDENELETDVVFTSAGSSVTANYEAVEEEVFVILRDANGNALQGQVLVGLLENPITGEFENPEYDNTMYIGGTYTFTVPGSIDGLYLHDWDGNIHFDDNTFTVVAEAGMEDIVVKYKEKTPVSITSSQSATLHYLDPWSTEPDLPLADWPTVPNDLTVFANEPIHSIPIYAPMVIQTVNDIVMSFDEFIWNPEEVSLTEYSPPLEMNNIKRADFHVPNATVTANYSPTDGLTNRKVNQLVPESTLFRW